MSRKRVLLVTRTTGLGGAERVIRRLRSDLADEFEVTLAITERGTAPPSGHWAHGRIGTLGALFRRADIVHSHLLLPGLLMRIRRIWDRRSRWIHTVHYDAYEGLAFARLKRWIDERWVFPAVDELVAVSASVEARLEKYAPKRVIVNAVEIAESADATTSEPTPQTDRILGTVSMLRPEKGLHDLVHAVHRARMKGAAIRLRIAGEGPERPRLEQLIGRLELGPFVELSGFVEDVGSFYESLDLYVQPSRSESFGIAALEAMSHGVPVIAAAVGHLPRLLDRGRHGMLVRRGPGFEDRLATALMALAEDDLGPWAARARAGFAEWAPLLSPARMVSEYRALYREALRPAVLMVAPIVTHSTGGLQRQLLLQSRELQARGYRVLVLQARDPELDREPKRSLWRHVRFLQTPALPRGASGGGDLSLRLRGAFFVVAGALLLVLHRHAYGLVHAHQLYSPTLLGAFANRFLGKPLVVKVTASGKLGESGQIRRLPFSALRRSAFRHIGRLIVLNGEMRDEMLELGFDRSIVREIPNSVSIPDDSGASARRAARSIGEKRDSASEPPTEDDPFTLLFTGRISEEKRLDVVVRALRRVGERGHEVRLSIVGAPDPDRDVTGRLASLCADLPASTEVVFHGYRNDVDAFYEVADAFVLASSSEGMSNALLEALAHGVPSIASRIPPNEALIEDRVHGRLFPVGDEEALAEIIVELIEDRATGGTMLDRLAESGRERMSAEFSVPAVVDRIESVYREVLS